MKGDRLYNKALFEANTNNNEAAFELLNKAVRYKNPKAFYALGTWYLHGTYVKKDVPKAIDYLLSAAKYKYSEAFYDLGVCYEKGVGVEKNLDKAFEYYLQASLRGDKQSFYEVGRCYYYGIGVEEDKVLSDYWLERAEELGITE
ncbi:tetratricopeptide repeat protein [Ulvibacterium marinum]|uniref:Sel1 repeat family protein n=1 Tax=Ulvibacterium marinum TaxID=2419782 RepID=A0A3B0BWP7_9FLAO|nr:tetratricopeptide repeat protein [Ulvibacterium marinum]RKN77815.1 sel1 repeat family protein [Ulvibacterium marinum]